VVVDIGERVTGRGDRDRRARRPPAVIEIGEPSSLVEIGGERVTGRARRREMRAVLALCEANDRRFDLPNTQDLWDRGIVEANGRTNGGEACSKETST
jgi:hypothetical protein